MKNIIDSVKEEFANNAKAAKNQAKILDNIMQKLDMPLNKYMFDKKDNNHIIKLGVGFRF